MTIEAVFAGDAGLNSQDGGPSSQMIPVLVFEGVDGCFVMDAPTGPVDFGNVPLDTSGQLTVLKPREACGNGMGSAQFTQLGNDSLSAFGEVRNNAPTWTIVFTPVTLGPQSTRYGFTIIGGGSPVCGPSNLTFTATGNGVP